MKARVWKGDGSFRPWRWLVQLSPGNTVQSRAESWSEAMGWVCFYLSDGKRSRL